MARMGASESQTWIHNQLARDPDKSQPKLQFSKMQNARLIPSPESFSTN